MPPLKIGVFGDAGNSLYNGSSFYYKPGWYELYNTGGTAPVQDAVAQAMRGWGVQELIQLGDTAYNAQSSSLLDYNIGRYYNDYMQPYGNKPGLFPYANSDSIYSTEAGGLKAELGKKQWPYNLYDFPRGYSNPVTGRAGGSADGKNHFWMLQGNHDYGTIIGTYNDFNVNQVNFRNDYIGKPEGPDSYDYQNNISKTDPNTPIKQPPRGPDGQVIQKIGSAQQLLDYLPWLQTGDDASQPSYLKSGQVRIGSNDPTGYNGIYYSVDLGETVSGGVRRPLLHVVMLDTPRIMVDAGYYDFNGKNKDVEAEEKSTLNKPLKSQNYAFDPTSPDQVALFTNPAGTPSGSSPSYQMFAWAKQDLAASNAHFKVVAGHHTAYHGGAVPEDANSNNFSSPIMVKFLAGLKDANGKPLLDAYWNGHSHAYSRVLEMGTSSDGIGAGIPVMTTGNGGKDQDYLNLVPYGSDVLRPQNWANTFTYQTPEGQSEISSNDVINKLTQKYLNAFPKGASPTSVGSSGPYRYNSNNIPQGFNLETDKGNAKKDPNLVSLYTKILTAPRTNQNPGDEPTLNEFKVTIPQYNSILPGATSNDSAVSGLYGYGSGAQYTEVDDGYLFMNYRTVVPLDPAIVLLGRQKGLKAQQMQRGSLFFEQWSPTNAKVENLAMFSFDVIIDATDNSGYLANLQLVQAGNGYLEQRVGVDRYHNGTYTIEIQGNNPKLPLPITQSDPSRAAVDLTFEGGQLKSVRFAKDSKGQERRGTDYKELANAFNGNNNNTSSGEPLRKSTSLLVGININLEAQYTFADQAPSGSPLYQDWYLMADTALRPTPAKSQEGTYGALTVHLQPRSPRARQIINRQPLTTGYSGVDAQASYATPQRGTLQLRDALGTVVAGGTDMPIRNGNVTLALQSRPAPGALQLSFSGDPYSSYLVNHRPATTAINIAYGAWLSPLRSGPNQSLSIAPALAYSVTRTDSLGGALEIGLLPQVGAGMARRALTLLADAQAASADALTTERIFTPRGPGSWVDSIGKPQGSSAAASAVIPSGLWRPIATDSNGVSHRATAVTVSGNTASIRFEGGYAAQFSIGGTGSAQRLPGSSALLLSVQRGGLQQNGLALYPADPITGAITDSSGKRLLPGHSSYLQTALEHARRSALVIEPDRLPAYLQEGVLTGLPLQANTNYGLLLLRNNNPTDLVSSYAAANADREVAMQSFSAPGRGVIFAIEDQPLSAAGPRDYADLIVSLSSAELSLV